MAWDIWIQALASAPVTVPLLTAAGGYLAGTARAITTTVVPPLLTPAAAAAGEALADRVRARIGTVAMKAVEMVGPDPAGILTDQTSLAVMRAAAGVDDPDLQTMFARLLASEMREGQVHPSLVRILAEMSPEDARLFGKVVRPSPLAARTMSDGLVFADPSISEESAAPIIEASLAAIVPVPQVIIARTYQDERDAILRRAKELGVKVEPQANFVRLAPTAKGRRFARVVLPPPEAASTSDLDE